MLIIVSEIRQLQPVLGSAINGFYNAKQMSEKRAWYRLGRHDQLDIVATEQRVLAYFQNAKESTNPVSRAPIKISGGINYPC